MSTPTLLIWGKNDPFVRRMRVEPAADYMRDPYPVIEADAGHWLVQEVPDLVYQEPPKHLRANGIELAGCARLATAELGTNPDLVSEVLGTRARALLG